MGEQAAKSMMSGIMNMFGMGGKKEESNVEAGAASPITNLEASGFDDEDTGVEVTGLTFGGSELISAAKNDREMVGENISSLEEPAPN